MADRQKVYPEEVPFDTDFLSTNKDSYVGLGKFGGAILGYVDIVLNGLECTPTFVPSLDVVLNPGEIYQSSVVDATPYGTLPIDSHLIVRQSIFTDATNITITPPGTPGFSINYLIEVANDTTDTDAASRPFYNTVNPNNPIYNTVTQVRNDAVIFQLKAGVAAPTGTQVTPTPDPGFTGAWVVMVAEGQTQITTNDITPYAGTLFLLEKLQDKISIQTGDQRYARIAQIEYASGVINGDMIITQREPASLTSGFTVNGTVDRMLGQLQGTGITSGTLDQTTLTLPIGDAKALFFNSVSITSNGIVVATHRIESNNAINYNSRSASFSCYVQHTVGSAINYQIFIYKADNKNDFSSTTLIGISSLQSVPSGIPTLITFQNVSMGDCTNGIQIGIETYCGSVSSQDFYISQMQLNTGSFATAFIPSDETFTRGACQRIYAKSYDDEVPVSTSTSAGVSTANCIGPLSSDFTASVRFPQTMVTIPTIRIFNPVTGTEGEIRGAAGDNVSAVFNNNNSKSFIVNNIGAIITGDVYSFHWEAVVDL